MPAPEELTTDFLLAAYRIGCFPMAESRNAEEIYWFSPEKRGILPLDHFHVPARLARLARQKPFTVTADRAFPQVIAACAEPRPGHEDTWINPTILELYCELAKQGHAHSIECWQNDQLVGGLYGIAIGGAFFGESMFSRVANASRIALVHLVERLNKAGYRLLDTQYVNAHLVQFGVREIPRADYLLMLQDALRIEPKACF